ncbi:MAG TPA: universal stress protein [Solirubrobacterales bacterium]|nr:universal stress protein [Solirubrobacterales bacterium]
MFRKILVGIREEGSDPEAVALGDRLALASGAEVRTVHAEGADELAPLAAAEAADLVVLGPTHHAGFGRLVPGATVERLGKEAPCALAVAPRGFGSPPREPGEWRPLDGEGSDAGLRVIGVGFDGSPSSRGALELATDLALENGATLRVYAVAHKLGPIGSDPVSATASPAGAELDAVRGALHEAVAALPDETRALPVLLRGYPAEKLVEAAKAGVDLLVIGSRGGGPVWRAFHGSVSSAVVDNSPCPVLIAPLSLHREAPPPAAA